MSASDEAEGISIVTGEQVCSPPRRIVVGRPPSLGIVHLLLWTACCAAVFGLARALMHERAGAGGAIVLVLVAMGHGAAWAGLAITLARTFRGRTWPIEPGQWLLALLGVLAAVEWLTGFTAPRRILRDPQGVVLAITGCAFVVPLFSRRLPLGWKWLFGAFSLLCAAPLLFALVASQIDMPVALGRVASQLTLKRILALTAVGAGVLAACERDRRQRTWLHWAGIVTAAWLALLAQVAGWLS